MIRYMLLLCFVTGLGTTGFAQETKKAETTERKQTASKEAKASDEKNSEKKKPVKTRMVKARGLELEVPETWKQAKNASRMRLVTLEIPAAEGDQDKGELTVFMFPMQSVDDNLGRWVGQFQPKGRKSKIVKGKTAKKKSDYYTVEVSGTYKKSIGPPMLQKTEDKPGYAMFATILPVKGQGMYFIKFTGPAKTVKAQAASFRKSFDGDAKAEKVYKKK